MDNIPPSSASMTTNMEGAARRIPQKEGHKLSSRLLKIGLMQKRRRATTTTNLNNNTSHSFQQRRSSGDLIISDNSERNYQRDLWKSDHGVSTTSTKKRINGSSRKIKQLSSGDVARLDAEVDDEQELDLENTSLDSRTMLESLGDNPSSDALANVAALRANEYIAECLSMEVPSGVVERVMWENIPQFTKMDLIVGQHLGKGTFSDVFEVIASVVEDDEPPTRESLDLDSANLDKLINKKFHSQQESEDPNSTNRSTLNHHRVDKDSEKTIIQDLDNFKSEECRAQIDDGRNHIHAPRRHTAEDIARSAIVGTSNNIPTRTYQTLAMKCLRPQTRSNMDQFMIGVEDLVNETAMLASLYHPNIIKLHGRAGGCTTNSFRLSDGFFILLDRLRDTLDDRIRSWNRICSDRKAPSPWTSQIKTACSIADAMSYLHSKNIVFRDLKPANVGFDSDGVVKLFDFGFAKCVVDPLKSSSLEGSSSGYSEDDGKQLSHLLYERCGTVRYMAPEVGLEMGHSLPADVYSYGILLWEICSLKKPFDNIKSPIDFERNVFKKGYRPKLAKEWSDSLKDIMSRCWLTEVDERPTMLEVKSRIHAHAREVSDGGTGNNNNNNSGRRSSLLFRKFSVVNI